MITLSLCALILRGSPPLPPNKEGPLVWYVFVDVEYSHLAKGFTHTGVIVVQPPKAVFYFILLFLFISTANVNVVDVFFSAFLLNIPFFVCYLIY